MSFMGVDIGTTGCKVIAFDINGKNLAIAYKEYPLISPKPGWGELDARVVIDNCKECISKVAGIVKKNDPVAAIAMSSQGEAFTIVDKNGQFLCNAMVSFDNRCKKQVSEYTQKLGLDNIYKTTGASPHTMFTFFKLAWLKENHPAILKKAHRILCFEDLLGFELTGEAVVDYSLAARTMMWDVNKKDWSQKIISSIGIDKEILPKSMPSGKVVGKVKKQLCEQLNLSENVVVVTGGHDQPCGAFGAGVVEPGTASYATGTVECITPAFNKLMLSDELKESNLAVYPHVVEGLYTTIAFNLTGGNLLRWFRDQFGQQEIAMAKEKNLDVYDLILKEIPKEPTNILVLPHFVATGTPHFDSHPTSAVLGMSLTTTRGHVIKSLLEGVSYEMRLNVEILAKSGIKINQLRAIGGGAKSETWMQLKSDIMGLPIVSLNVSEAACMGAAMLAAVGCGSMPSAKKAAEKWVVPNKTFHPDKTKVELYNKRYNIYKDLYKTIKPLGEELNKLT